MWREFRDFAMRGNVIDLAVGIIIGAAFTTIVNSLVNDLIMPPLGRALGGIDFSDFFVTLKGGSYPTLAAAKAAGAVTVNYGLFINAIMRFVIVAFAMTKRIDRVDEEPVIDRHRAGRLGGGEGRKRPPLRVTKKSEKSMPPSARPIGGMMRSLTSELTIVVNAAPMMIPTARSMTLPRIAKSRNSRHMLASPVGRENLA